MTGETFRQTVAVTNPQGFHMRPIREFVDTVKRFTCSVTVTRDGMPPVNGKSILSLMGLAAEQGTELVIETVGPDAAETLAALVQVFSINYDDA